MMKDRVFAAKISGLDYAERAQHVRKAIEQLMGFGSLSTQTA